MKNITYLFGAGASKQALPIVNEIPDRVKKIKELVLEFNSIFSKDEMPISKNIKSKTCDCYYKFLDDLDWLYEMSNNNASVDTYAKKLYLKNEWDDLNKLKNIFSAYLSIEQIVNKPDSRYDSFFAAILDEDFNIFPDNIRILSWNYDFQIEMAYASYLGDYKILSSKNSLKVSSKYDKNPKYSNDRFGIFKINGTASLISKDRQHDYLYFNDTNLYFDADRLKTILAQFSSLIEFKAEVDSALSFAWEHPKYSEDIIININNACKDANVVVVIGYSFPFFNRNIDRRIFNEMKSLEKVYFQAPDAENIKERFMSIREDIDDENLVCKKDTWQFYLPNEL